MPGANVPARFLIVGALALLASPCLGQATAGARETPAAGRSAPQTAPTKGAVPPVTGAPPASQLKADVTVAPPPKKEPTFEQAVTTWFKQSAANWSSKCPSFENFKCREEVHISLGTGRAQAIAKVAGKQDAKLADVTPILDEATQNAIHAVLYRRARARAKSQQIAWAKGCADQLCKVKIVDIFIPDYINKFRVLAFAKSNPGKSLETLSSEYFALGDQAVAKLHAEAKQRTGT